MPRSNKNARSNKNSKLRLSDLTPKQRKKFGAIAKKMPKGFGTLAVAEFELAKAKIYSINTELKKMGVEVKLETQGITSLTPENARALTKQYQETASRKLIPIHKDLQLTTKQLKQFTEIEKERVEALTKATKKVLAKQWYERGEAVPDMTVGDYKKNVIGGFDEYWSRPTKITEFLDQDDYREHMEQRFLEKKIGYTEILDRNAKNNYLKAMDTAKLLDTEEGRELARYIRDLPLDKFIDIFVSEKDAQIDAFLYSGADVENKLSILRRHVWKIDAGWRSE